MMLVVWSVVVSPRSALRAAMAMRWRHELFLLPLLAWIATIISFIHRSGISPLAALQWSTAQWMPWPFTSIGNSLQQTTWDAWKEIEGDGLILDCPVLDLSGTKSSTIRKRVEEKYGKDWRDRPLLLKGLWSASDLSSTDRRLSLTGLLKEDIIIPYFTNASVSGALSPDSRAPVSKVVANMTSRGLPHKIGTQLVVQTYPELIKEVAPTAIVTELFGDFFKPEDVSGSGPFRLFPAMTTVPLFVARTGAIAREEDDCADNSEASTAHPRTDLHCEPISNVAVQLHGEKQWMLVSPQHSFRIRPAAAPDGRAFFASWSDSFDHVPRYYAITRAGDALWIPTWTWHRVDYIGSSGDVAIGGSLFHFRPYSYVRNNPLFALLVIPSLIKEVIGCNTQ